MIRDHTSVPALGSSKSAALLRAARKLGRFKKAFQKSQQAQQNAGGSGSPAAGTKRASLRTRYAPVQAAILDGQRGSAVLDSRSAFRRCSRAMAVRRLFRMPTVSDRSADACLRVFASLSTRWLSSAEICSPAPKNDTAQSKRVPGSRTGYQRRGGQSGFQVHEWTQRTVRQGLVAVVSSQEGEGNPWGPTSFKCRCPRTSCLRSALAASS